MLLYHSTVHHHIDILINIWLNIYNHSHLLLNINMFCLCLILHSCTTSPFLLPDMSLEATRALVTEANCILWLSFRGRGVYRSGVASMKCQILGHTEGVRFLFAMLTFRPQKKTPGIDHASGDQAPCPNENLSMTPSTLLMSSQAGATGVLRVTTFSFTLFQ